MQPVLFTVFAVVGIMGQDGPPLLLSSECCYRKEVGGVIYNQVAGDTGEFPSCRSDCVYEKQGDTGSRFCFAKGGMKSECKEFKLNITDVPMTYMNKADDSSIMEWISFKTSIGQIKCTIGVGLTYGSFENITCNLGDLEIDMNPETDETNPDLENNNMASMVMSENGWMAMHMSKSIIYCTPLGPFFPGPILPPFRQGFTLPPFRPGPIPCLFLRGEKNVIFAQDSFKDKKTQTDCKNFCDGDVKCKFWTFSSMDTAEAHNDRVHDDGVTECGIRTYTPGNLINVYNADRTLDNKQSCALQNSKAAGINYAQVFVQKAFPPTKVDNPYLCAKKCKNSGEGCKHWTWSYVDFKCVLSRFTPTRKIPIFGSESNRVRAIVSSGTINDFGLD